jgi:cytochrome bd-type quinol oxidase subunit 2
MILLGVSGLGLGTGFTGMLAHLTSSVTAEHAADVSGLFNTATRGGGVVGTAAFGSLYLTLAPAGSGAAHATRGFGELNIALAATALAAGVMAVVAVSGKSRTEVSS